MIITLSMNPCIDRTLSVAAFEYGGMNRVQDARDDACGKAVNLALVAAALGGQARCLGLLPEEDGAKISARLESGGVQTAFIGVPGRLRVNIKLLDESRGIITEINERGGAVRADQLDDLTALVMDTVRPGDWLALTGSMPPGCDGAYYAELIRRTRGICRCALDAEGAPLRLGIEQRPALIKPNRAELEQLLGKSLRSMAEVADAAREIQSSGVDTVVVTLGAEGALLVDAEGALIAPALDLPVRSTVGAGDSMLAGLLCGYARGAPRETAFRTGVAAAAASVVSEGTQLVDAGVYRDMLDRATISKVVMEKW